MTYLFPEFEDNLDVKVYQLEARLGQEFPSTTLSTPIELESTLNPLLDDEIERLQSIDSDVIPCGVLSRKRLYSIPGGFEFRIDEFAVDKDEFRSGKSALPVAKQIEQLVVVGTMLPRRPNEWSPSELNRTILASGRVGSRLFFEKRKAELLAVAAHKGADSISESLSSRQRDMEGAVDA